MGTTERGCPQVRRLTADRHRCRRRWRATRDAGCRDQDGWLTLVGLHWLSADTKTTVGGPGGQAAVKLTPATVPDAVGVVEVVGAKVTLTAAIACTVTTGKVQEPHLQPIVAMLTLPTC